MFRQKLKKIAAILTILVLLPFIVTVFLNGTESTGTSDALDTYCIGVLAKEVSDTYEDEMLKAQAVLVRTTIYKEVQEKGGNIDFENVYAAKEELSSNWYQRLQAIWEETDGQVLLYENALAMTPFHNLSNGKTRSGKEVLGSDEYPYLQSVECPKDVESELQISSKLIDVKSAEIISKDSAGYVTEVKMGEETVSGEHFRNTYELSSSCFLFQEAGDKLRVTTNGIGHGLGLSQNTANELAKEGKTYEEILSYFFPGTNIKEVAEVLINIE